LFREIHCAYGLYRQLIVWQKKIRNYLLFIPPVEPPPVHYKTNRLLGSGSWPPPPAPPLGPFLVCDDDRRHELGRKKYSIIAITIQPIMTVMSDSWVPSSPGVSTPAVLGPDITSLKHSLSLHTVCESLNILMSRCIRCSWVKRLMHSHGSNSSAIFQRINGW